jgi:hypothetical protein
MEAKLPQNSHEPIKQPTAPQGQTGMRVLVSVLHST